MILWLDLGVQGAAIATVIGNMVASLIYASYFFRKPTQLSIMPRDFRPTGRLTWDIISIGIPSAATSLLATLANVLMNRTLVAYGNNAVAGMGVAMKVNTVARLYPAGIGNRDTAPDRL